MATDVATLRAILVADTSKYASGLNKATKESQRFERNSSKTFKKVAKAAAGLATAYVGISAAKDAVKTTVDLAKATAGLARVTGMSTKEASRWSAVAKSRNIDGKALNMSFITLSKTMRKANDDTSAQAKLLQKLGVSQKTITSGNTSDALMAISDAFAKMPDGANKAAIAQQLFGRQMQGLLPLINKGSGALREQLALSDKYGMTMDKKQVAAALAAAAAQRELNMAMDGIKIAFATKVLPILTKAYSALAPVLASVGRAMSTFFTQMQNGTGAGGTFAAIMVGAFNTLKSAVQTTVSVINTLSPAIAGLTAAYVAWKAVQAVQYVQSLIAVFGVLRTVYIAQTGVTNASTLAILRHVIATKAMAAAQKAAAAASLVMNAIMAVNPFVAIAAAVAIAAVLIIKNWDKVKAFLNKTWTAIKSFAASAFERIKSYASKGLLGPIPLIIARWGQIKKTITDVITSVKNTLARAVNTFKSAGSKIGGALFDGIKGAISNVADIGKGLANAVIGLLNSAIPNKIPIPGAPDIDFPDNPIPKFAKGGRVGNSPMQLVGERGPELVSLPTGSYVHTANKTRAILSDGTQVQALAKGGTVSGYKKRKTMLGTALRIARKGMPYQWGGYGNPSYDCSGYASAVVNAAGYGFGRRTTMSFPSVLRKGAGENVTFGIRNTGNPRTSHMMFKIGSRYFESGGGHGPKQVGGWNGSFTKYHLPDDAALGKPGKNKDGGNPRSGRGGGSFTNSIVGPGGSGSTTVSSGGGSFTNSISGPSGGIGGSWSNPANHLATPAGEGGGEGGGGDPASILAEIRDELRRQNALGDATRNVVRGEIEQSVLDFFNKGVGGRLAGGSRMASLGVSY